jgi:hypothetical protein
MLHLDYSHMTDKNCSLLDTQIRISSNMALLITKLSLVLWPYINLGGFSLNLCGWAQQWLWHEKTLKHTGFHACAWSLRENHELLRLGKGIAVHQWDVETQGNCDSSPSIPNSEEPRYLSTDENWLVRQDNGLNKLQKNRHATQGRREDCNMPLGESIIRRLALIKYTCVFG